MDSEGCRNACNFLELPLGGTFRDSKLCYRAKNGKCRQDGRHGSKVFIVCKNAGNAIKNANDTLFYYQLFYYVNYSEICFLN